MHSVDIIEDIAIALHLNKFKPEWPRIWTAGSQAEETDEIDTIGEIMIGLGFQEVLTYVLTSMQVAVDNMQTSSDGLIKLLNPRMSTHTVARNWLLPSLIEFLSRNTHVDYPQKIFEIGATINRGVDTNQPVAERSSLDALMDNAGWTFQIRETTHPSFLPGRCGAILSAGRNIGTIGELSPRVLRAWGLNLPAAAFDLTIPRREPTGVAE
jgi:phenylalanyl-tRNA synthetase beta chain